MGNLSRGRTVPFDPATSPAKLSPSSTWTATEAAKVLTVSTPLASNWVVNWSDWLGFVMFFGRPRVFKAWKTVRVSPRAQCFRRSHTFCLFTVDKA